jgi:hypothetical protein
MAWYLVKHRQLYLYLTVVGVVIDCVDYADLSGYPRLFQMYLNPVSASPTRVENTETVTAV